LASEVSGHSNEEQNTIYSVLTNLREMVHEQDYGSDKYVGTVIEPIAARLASLCQGMALNQPTGGMKKKPGKRVGPSAKHRLGSEKSTVSRLYRTNADFVEVAEMVHCIIHQVPIVLLNSLGEMSVWK
jgi:hypothetical protein